MQPGFLCLLLYLLLSDSATIAARSSNQGCHGAQPHHTPPRLTLSFHFAVTDSGAKTQDLHKTLTYLGAPILCFAP